MAVNGSMNLASNSSVTQIGGYIIYNGTPSQVKKAAINAAISGNNTLVAAVAGKKIVVTAILINAAGTVTANIQSGAGGTTLSGPMTLATSTGFCAQRNIDGWFETAAGSLLNLNLSAGVQCSGFLNYIEV